MSPNRIGMRRTTKVLAVLAAYPAPPHHDGNGGAAAVSLSAPTPSGERVPHLGIADVGAPGGREATRDRSLRCATWDWYFLTRKYILIRKWPVVLIAARAPRRPVSSSATLVALRLRGRAGARPLPWARARSGSRRAFQRRTPTRGPGPSPRPLLGSQPVALEGTGRTQALSRDDLDAARARALSRRACRPRSGVGPGGLAPVQGAQGQRPPR